jgi:hypothetical protein
MIARRRFTIEGANHGKSDQENASGAGAAGVAICWASLDMGSYAALEECAETISITPGNYDNRFARNCDSACLAKQ